MSDFPAPPPPTGGGAIGPRPGDLPLRTTPDGLQPLKTLTTALTVMLVLAALITAMSALTFAARVATTDDILNNDATDEEILDADEAVESAATMTLLVFGATAIVWIMWQYRYVRNAERYGSKLRWGPGWAIGGWLIPIANIAIPTMQLKESAEASDRERRAPPLLFVWLGTWILANVVLRFSVSLQPPDDEQEALSYLKDFQTADRVAVFADLLYVAAAIFAIVLVRRLARGQSGEAQ